METDRHNHRVIAVGTWEMKKRDMQKQKGITMVSMAIIAAVFAFFVLLGIRLVPVYVESLKVGSSLESLGEGKTDKFDEQALTETLMRRLKINDVSSVTPADISMQRVGGQVRVDVRYEARVHILGNVDAIARFEKSKAVSP